MKLVVVLLAALSLASADGFLGLVPGVEPEAIARDYVVIGQMADGVLVLAGGGQRGDFASRQGIVLGAVTDEPAYYRVRLADWVSLPALVQLSPVLYTDGVECVVRLAEDDIPGVLALRAELTRIRLEPMVFRTAAPVLPRVFSNPAVQMVVSEVNPDTVLAVVRRLQDYRTRYSTGDSCRAAAQWICDKFRAYGCDSVYLQPHTTNHAPNVIAIKYGTRGQRQPHAIICGHFDSYAPSNAPGADDNASGTAAVLEAARVMRNYEYGHDIRYIAFSGEEFGLYGSQYYAGQARGRGDSILGVFNFDMIGYVDVAPENLELVTKISNPPCEPFSDFFIACADTYTTLLTNKQMVSDNQNSDHGPFWSNGYLAFCGIEDFWPVNPHYHTSHDSIGAGYNSNEFCTEVTRAAVAALATICEPVPLNVPLVGLLRARIDDAAGNANGKWDAGESVAVHVTLRNYGMVAAHNVNAAVSANDPYVTLYDSASGFGDIAPQETAVGLVPFTMRAATTTPREHPVVLGLTVTATESTWTGNVNLTIGEILVTDPIPDGPRSPPRYWAFDDVDASYPEHPTYDWVEISAQGTRIPYAQNDDVAVVSLPTGFGPLRFYGQRYSQISVSADGWVCPGSYTTRNYGNTPLPNPNTPPGAICLNWDDLYPDLGGRGYVYWHHDAPNHRLIVEYDSVAYYAQQSVRDKFQLIVYDTTVATATGDNALVAQYRTANGYGSSTVGILDPTRAVAIQVLYNGTLTRGAAPVAAGRAIKYVTADPTAVHEASGPGLELRRARLAVQPSMVRGQGLIRFSIPADGPVELVLFDQTGKCCGTVVQSTFMKAGEYSRHLNTQGLAGGVYFLCLRTREGQQTAKAVIAVP